MMADGVSFIRFLNKKKYLMTKQSLCLGLFRRRKRKHTRDSLKAVIFVPVFMRLVRTENRRQFRMQTVRHIYAI
jgi:hypothetical protein